MEILETIPTLRIFDEAKAREFYIDWLGFSFDWEHRFDEKAPLFCQISLRNLKIFLSEHHGDGAPGSHVFIRCTGLKEYHQQLIAKKYKYGRPGLEKTFYDSIQVMVNDPFGNKLAFNEDLKEKTPEG